MSNAVVTVDSSWVERAVSSKVLGVPSVFWPRKRLIASKLFVTRRERFDGADHLHVSHGTQGKLDWDRVMQLVGEHWGIVLWAMMLFQYTYPAHSNYIPRKVSERPSRTIARRAGSSKSARSLPRKTPRRKHVCHRRS